MNEPTKALKAEPVDPLEFDLSRLIRNGARAAVGAFEQQVSHKVGVPVNVWDRGVGSIVNQAITDAGIGPITPVGLARKLGILGPVKVTAARRNRQ